MLNERPLLGAVFLPLIDRSPILFIDNTTLHHFRRPVSCRSNRFHRMSPETSLGQFNLRVNATYLDEYKERTSNPDGTESVNDLTGRHPDETFFRAFAEWRMVTGLDWAKDRLSGGLTIRPYRDGSPTRA